MNLINHVALVLDASSSMHGFAKDLVRVADDQISYLARRSKELNQETRVTVYTFADQAKCVIYDMDVLRLPSIATLYTPGGNTALIDATVLCQKDFDLVSTKYGDHSFLTFVLTDGEENVSILRPDSLKALLADQDDSRTVAVLVPNQRAAFEAKRFGFPAGNVSVWDTTSSTGVEEAMQTVRAATDNYMIMRSKGVRSSKNLFDISTTKVNAKSVAALKIKPLGKSDFIITHVDADSRIDDFVDRMGHKFVTGRGFYQLMKPEKIQADKVLAVVEKKTRKVYVGDGVRDLLGLPDLEVRVNPTSNPDYDIYVQSKALNRKLLAHTSFLYLLK